MAFTHKERVLAALFHRQPDRVPIDLGGSAETSIVVEGYEKLKGHFNIRSDTRLSHRMMRTAAIDEAILQALDIDTRAVFPGDLKETRDLGPDCYRSAWGVERVRPPHSFYFDQRKSPLSGEISISDIVRYPWPDPDHPGIIRGLRDRMTRVREHTDCAVVLTIPSPFIQHSQSLRGFQDWYMDLVLRPDRAEALFDAVLEVTLRMTENILKAAGDLADVVMTADDIGGQQGLLFSYDHYLRFIKPRHKKFFQLVRDLTPAKILLHCCGSIARILDDLIELGVDAVNPVQTSAAGMDPVQLKKTGGDRMSFWGGIDTQQTLPFGSVEDVKRMVEQRIEELGEGGGYVLCAVHNIQPDVPLENILAMYRHAREYVPSYLK